MFTDSKIIRSRAEVVRGPQLRAARALLDWSIPEAAEKCEVGRNTISRLEKGERSPGVGLMEQIIRTFEENGVLFIDTNVGVGVLLNDRGLLPAKPQ